MTISDWMATLALINGTAGGVVLVLPIIGLDAGWLTIPIIVFVTSLCCYYTAVIMFQHLGNAQTINQCIRNHFRNQRVCQFYNLIMFLSFFGQMLIYYDLLVDETEGILYFLHQNIKDDFPYFVAIFLIILSLVTRFYHFEDDLLGYGVISILAFCLFTLWIIVKRQPGPKTLAAVENNFIDLAAAMSQGYSIHNMMIPIILRARNPKNYKKILANVFFIAAIIYTFIAYGSFAILNRYTNTGTAQTVQDYFSGDQWEIYILRGIYIINIITVFPQFLSISRIRFFNLFQEENKERRIRFRQILYYLVIIGICLATKIFQLKVSTLIELNGAIICFLQIYFIPVVIHLKCIWWNYKQEDDGGFQLEHYNENNQTQFYQNGKIVKNSINHDLKQINNINLVKERFLRQTALQKKCQVEQQNKLHEYHCECHEQICYDKSTRYRQISTASVVLGVGVFVMIYTLYVVFFYKQPTVS